MLTDSAGLLWQQLSAVGRIEDLPRSDCFDEWVGCDAHPAGLEPIEAQKLRRAYRRLHTLLTELETLVQSRGRALELVRTRAAEG